MKPLSSSIIHSYNGRALVSCAQQFSACAASAVADDELVSAVAEPVVPLRSQAKILHASTPPLILFLQCS